MDPAKVDKVAEEGAPVTDVVDVVGTVVGRMNLS